ncbi:RagB/SusD family nutrient uptake outer membrane protein [Sphingobacterium hungaricum]|nr:RagB/SusD family nutrient uptake outer membrane protein [Sphingobacterium hungaricum]
MEKTIFCALAALLVLFSASCDKFLDTKPDQKLAVPQSLEDLQALLDDYTNRTMESAAGEISSGEYTVSDANLASLSSSSAFDRRMYQWDGDNLFEQGSSLGDWGRYYTTIYTCNTVLENLENIERGISNAAQYDQIRGRAFFWRAQKLFQASLIWCSAYDQRTAAKQLGLPIRLGTDFNEVSVRSDMQQTYRQILEDAESCIRLLPEQVSHPVQPGRCAGYMLLSRIHLYMGNYERSFLYADSALSIKNDLMDYSALNSSPTYPIARYNQEVIYQSAIGAPQILSISRANIVEEITGSYADGDLRKVLYFVRNTDGTYGFRGNYIGSAGLFMGYATDELYLLRAESAARTDRLSVALQDINALLSTRWKKVNGISTYQPIEEIDADALLAFILSERRKSLLFRGLRWYDLKRLNRDGANITLRRTIAGQEYALAANDLRYALPIPEDVIRISDMEQNPR